MNYYAARQLMGGDDKLGGWHYTCMNDGKVWAVGDCVEHAPHATKDEAYMCWTNYLLTNRLRLDHTEQGVKRQCKVGGCEEWTQRCAEVDSRIFHLCDEHRTPEVVRELFGVAGDAMASW